jgi:hypothetical protein
MHIFRKNVESERVFYLVLDIDYTLKWLEEGERCIRR